MKLILLILSLFSINVLASPFELFGPSAVSISQGHQAGPTQSADRHMYAGALIAENKTSSFSFNFLEIIPALTDINNIVTKNPVNQNGNTTSSGNVDVNTPATTMFAGHLTTPLFGESGPILGFSIIAPMDRMIEADTGDPYRPEYVMYRNRYLRPTVIFNLAQQVESWGFSLGGQTGFQSDGESYFYTRADNEPYPTVGKMTFNAKPSLGLLASVSKKWNQGQTYFSFTQEMKSKFSNKAIGATSIGGGNAFPFEFEISSLLYYDPQTWRLGHIQQINPRFSVMGMVEYQEWANYKTPKLVFKQQGGTLASSRDYENLRPRNILIPHLGVESILSENWVLRGGYFYRPTPLKTANLKNSGNSIDQDKHVTSLGLGRFFSLFGKRFETTLAYQFHYLRSQKIQKTAGLEDGSGGEKIGSPGYRIGGNIQVIALGINWAI